MRKLKIVGVWLLQGLMAIAMTGSGIEKFTRPAWERMFRVWGYPDHFYMVIGAVEAVCGLALLVPRLATPAALSLMVVMAGAAVTQMTHGRNGVGELVFVTVLGIIAFARRRVSWLQVPGSRFQVPGSNLEPGTWNEEPRP
jgi:uncharacterized membrane protein YphA (DoxX/SURF4 family)